MVMDLLNSGKMTPSQFEELKKQAMEWKRYFGSDPDGTEKYK